MQLTEVAASLERNCEDLQVVVAAISDGESAWKPATDSWSIREVVGHLADEEVENFRPRMRSTLETPAAE